MERTPRLRDKVWSAERHSDDRQPNGFISDIQWEDREIIVTFYRNQSKDVDIESFSFDDIDGCYTRNYGGVWIL